MIFLLCGGLALIFRSFSELLKAVLWLIYVDNAETGLPELAEILVKGIVEAAVVSILTCVGLSETNPRVKATVIILGSVACLIFYWIAKYIIWIMLGVLILAIIIITLSIIRRKKNKIPEGDVENAKVGV